MVIRLVLADDHAVVREGVCALLESDPEFEVVGQAADGAEVVDLVERLQPDVVVLDLMMPGAGGLEVTGQLARRPDPPAVLILSMHESEPYVVEAMRRGAAGYALKQAPAGELARGIRTVAAGNRYLSPPLSDRALDAYLRGPDQQQEPEDMLTVREREVLRLAADGRSNAEVAALLFISRRTVETHRARAMKKLGLRNHVELARYAMEVGIVPPSPASPSTPDRGAGAIDAGGIRADTDTDSSDLPHGMSGRRARVCRVEGRRHHGRPDRVEQQAPMEVLTVIAGRRCQAVRTVAPPPNGAVPSGGAGDRGRTRRVAGRGAGTSLVGASPREASQMSSTTHPALSIDIGREMATVIVTLEGLLDEDSSPALVEVLWDLVVGQGNLSVTVDARRLTLSDPVLICLFQILEGEAADKGGTLAVIEPPSASVERDRTAAPIDLRRARRAAALGMAAHPAGGAWAHIRRPEGSLMSELGMRMTTRTNPPSHSSSRRAKPAIAHPSGRAGARSCPGRTPARPSSTPRTQPGGSRRRGPLDPRARWRRTGRRLVTVSSHGIHSGCAQVLPSPELRHGRRHRVPDGVVAGHASLLSRSGPTVGR